VKYEILEKWWHNTTTEWVLNNRNITVVCPHPGLILNDHLLSETKGRLNATNTITIDLNQSLENQKKKTKQKKLKESLSPNQNQIFRFFILFLQNSMVFQYQMLV
jgi:hypothetical protein